MASQEQPECGKPPRNTVHALHVHALAKPLRSLLKRDISGSGGRGKRKQAHICQARACARDLSRSGVHHQLARAVMRTPTMPKADSSLRIGLGKRLRSLVARGGVEAEGKGTRRRVASVAI